MLILLFAAFIAWAVFTFLIKVIKTTVATAMLIAAVVVIIQVSNGVTPQDILQFITQFPQSLQKLSGTR